MRVDGWSVWKSELLTTVGGDPDSVVMRFCDGDRDVSTLVAVIRMLDDRLAFIEAERKALQHKAVTRASFTADGRL